MKRILCAALVLMLAVCGVALAENLAPMFESLNTTDASHPVSFKRENLKDGVLNDVEIYSMDLYDPAAVEKLAVGDTFTGEGREVTVETLETDEFGQIVINGGYLEDNGFTLTKLDEEYGDGWRTTTDDDFATYTLRDTLSLTLDENVTFEDTWDIDGEPVNATGIEAVTNAIMTSENDRFHELSTELRLEDGKVVEIIRSYVP